MSQSAVASTGAINFLRISPVDPVDIDDSVPRASRYQCGLPATFLRTDSRYLLRLIQREMLERSRLTCSEDISVLTACAMVSSTAGRSHKATPGLFVVPEIAAVDTIGQSGSGPRSQDNVD